MIFEIYGGDIESTYSLVLYCTQWLEGWPL